ncbi:MAG: hypothetical protein IIA61_06085 [Candidatus Marinimicrobia bacterium]|nr:hypothetical protein [Candidatus Neomarinimicrobiota bacterium]
MSSELILAPVLSDKLEEWKQWLSDLNGSRSSEYKDFLERYGITRDRVWLQQNPDGSYLAAIIHEGEGASTMMQKFATSDHPFDVEFRNKVAAAHGIDFTQPPPPGPELLSDFSL